MPISIENNRPMYANSRLFLRADFPPLPRHCHESINSGFALAFWLRLGLVGFAERKLFNFVDDKNSHDDNCSKKRFYFPFHSNIERGPRSGSDH